MPSLREWRAACVVGTLLLVGGAGGTAYAERTVASGLAASFVSFEPALILLMSLGLKKWPTRNEILGIALGLLGVALLMKGKGFSASPVGLVAMLVATVAWSTGSILATTRFLTAPGPVDAASQMICGGLILLFLSRLTNEPAHWPTEHPAIGAWLYLVLFGSLLAFTAFAYLLAHVRTSLAMSYTFVNPIVAVALGALFGAERFTPNEVMATVITATGVLLLLRDSRPDHAH